MVNKKATENYSSEQQAVQPSVNPFVSLSFYGLLDCVKSKIEFDFFTARDMPLAHEICMAITEVLKLNPTHEIKIDGEILPVEMVQEIYRKVTHDHIQLVIDNFKKYTTELHSKKAFFRTAVYNSVFELESSNINHVNADLYGHR
jgi:hypothetical protein